jgi:hypothetical protein
MDRSAASYNNSIAINSSDEAYISYVTSNKDLRYFTNASSWTSFEVDGTGTCGSLCAIAVDPDKKIHIAYQKTASPAALHYATNTPGTWQNELVGTLPIETSYFTITAFAKQQIHMAVSTLDRQLRYVDGELGSWTEKSLTPTLETAMIYNSITVNSSNEPSIAYVDTSSGNLVYTRKSGTKWSSVEVDTSGNVSEEVSLGIDKNGYAHISYYAAGQDHDLKYATNSPSGNWSTTALDTAGMVGQYNSLAVDKNGKIHISYYDASNGALKYATNSSGNWASQTVETGTGYYTAIAVDSNCKPYIVYTDTSMKILKVAVLQ